MNLYEGRGCDHCGAPLENHLFRWGTWLFCSETCRRAMVPPKNPFFWEAP